LPIAVTGVALLGILELLGGQLPRAVVAAAQPLWWGIVTIALAQGLDPAPVAMVGAAGFLVLVESTGLRALAAPHAIAAVGLVLATAGLWVEPWWAFAGSVALAGWAGARRLHPYPVRYAVATSAALLDLAAGVLPVAAVVSLGLATQDASLAVLVPARLPVERRLLRRGPDDHFWTLWWDAGMLAAAAAVAVVELTYGPYGAGADSLLVTATVVLAAAAAAGPLPTTWRVWPVLALATWAWLAAADVASLPPGVGVGVLAVVALAIVVDVHVDPHRLDAWSHPGALGLAGHALAVVAVTVTGLRLGGALAVASTLATAGWAVTAAFDARGRSVVGELLRAVVHDVGRFVPPALAAVGLPLSAALVLDASGALPVSSPWAPATLAVAAVGYALAVRLPVGDAARGVLVWSSLAAGVLASTLSTERGPALAGLASVVLAAVVLAPARRPVTTTWIAWAAVAPLTGLAALALVPRFAGLDPTAAACATLVAVGSLLVVGALALDLRHRAWLPVTAPTDPVLRRPAVIGAAEVVVGLVLSLASLPPDAAGWLTAAVAVTVLVVSVLARSGAVTAVGLTIAWLSAGLLAGDRVAEAPWLSVVLTVVLLLAAEAAHRYVVDRRWWARLDLPLVAVAHVTALTALATAGDGDRFSRTLAALGVIAVTGAVRCRATGLLAWSYGVVGTVLVLAAAAYAGQGWLALALAALTVGCSAVAARVGETARRVMIVLGALAALAAWVAAIGWMGLSVRDSVDATVALAAMITLSSAVLLRWTDVDRGVLLVRGVLAVATATVAPFVPWLLASPEPAALELTVVTWVALLLVALAAAVVARPLPRDRLRYVAIAYVVAAEVEALVVAAATAGQQVAVLGATSLVCSVVVLVPLPREWLSDWRTPLMALGAGTALTAVVIALTELPDTWLMPPTLLIAAAQIAAISLAARSMVLGMLVPPLVCAAWLFYAASALDGNPQWVMVPIGLTVLVVVGLMRARLRQAHQDPAPVPVVLLELVGIACLVGPSFVQALTVALGYAALAAAIGVLVGAWGLVTRVRRRLLTGALVVLLAALVLVGVPLALLVPAWTGATLWIVLIAVGVLAILGATLLEQGRAVVRRGTGGLRRLTAGWE
jgi:hypothetical protein